MSRRPRIRVLCPYSPWPVDTGARAEMWKHLDALLELGEVTLLTARGKPVGTGWSEEALATCTARGLRLVFREDETRNGPDQWLGNAYAAVAKGLGLERAFGHANPYHRRAFPLGWWTKHTADADLVVSFYSYWCHLPSQVPKVCALLDLWSDVMWGGHARETADLASCDAVWVISTDEVGRLRGRGVGRLHWSPPVAEAWSAPDSARIGLVGSDNRFNREGLAWLASGAPADAPRIRVYGKLAEHATAPCFEPVGRYADSRDPYRECGVMLFTAPHATGVQIKTIEALAAGRAIVSRPESVRGLPTAEPGWITARTPREMWAEATRLAGDAAERAQAAGRAAAYHREHLDAERIRGELRRVYAGLLAP